MSKHPTFPGFESSFFDFFEELIQNNDRDWFAENKPRYKHDVVGPLQDFIIAMEPRLEEVSPHYICDPRGNGGSMFRIYRDVRFSKDKRPYKEHAACQFRHVMAKDVHAPGFYVHLEPEQVFFGGGVWRPDSKALNSIREDIRDRGDEWAQVRDLVSSDGESLKRPPRGFSADEPFIDDLKRKSFFAMRSDSTDLARSPEFIDQVAAAFAEAAPMMRFICRAVDAPF